MGNHAKRKEVARLLKQQGLGKLYRGNSNVARTMLSKGCLNELLFKLKYKAGDLVNDCDGYNHVLVKWLPEKRYSENWIGHDSRVNGKYKWIGLKGTSVADLDQFEIEEGRWSCGCPYSPDPPRSREDIEKDTLRYLSDPNTDWHRDSKREAILLALQAGQHICDESGILLPEFR